MSPHRSAHLALALGAALLSVVALTLVGAVTLLVAGRSLHAAVVPIAAGLTAVWVWLWAARYDPRRGWWIAAAVIAATAGVISVSAAGGSAVLDATYDGQWIHQEAVLQLAAGWNPVERDLSPAEVADDGARARLNGYAKGSWMCGASLYRLTGRIEHNKAFSLVLLVAAGCITWAALILAGGLSRFQATVVAAVAACNPIAVTQVLNAQLDGDVASVVLIIVASLAVCARARLRLALAVLAAALVVGFGLKLTAPLFCAGAVLAGLALVVVAGTRLAPVLATITVGGLVGLLGVSFTPYVTNTVRHGHPLYPALGPERITLMNAPPHGRLHTLGVSVLSRSRHFANSRKAVEHLLTGQDLKAPGTFDRDEVQVFVLPDVRVGGWGPLFGAVALLAAATAAAGGRRVMGLAAMIGGPLLATVLAFPHPWFARFVPHLWLVPLVAVPLTLGSGRRLARGLGWLTLVAAAGNVLLITAGHLHGVVPHSSALEARLRGLGDRGPSLQLDLGRFRSNRARLAELGIGFTEVDDPRFDLPTYLGSPQALVRALDVVMRSSGPVVVLDLVERTGVTHHTVRVLPVAAGHAGRTPEHRLDGWHGEVPAPFGTVFLELAACNALDCGPPRRLGPLPALHPQSKVESRRAPGRQGRLRSRWASTVPATLRTVTVPRPAETLAKSSA